MRLIDRFRNRTAAFVHDLAMIPAAWFCAYWLRFNLEPIPGPILDQAIAVLPVVLVVQGVVFWYFGLYRGVWRFASIPDLIRILKAVVVGVALGAFAIFFLTRMQDMPRSVFPLHAVLLLVFLGGPRLVYRWQKDRRLYFTEARKTLVVGAGQAGELLVRDLLRDRRSGYWPVAFADDDIAKKGHEIHGVRVLGNCEKIPRLVQRLQVDLVLIAVPSATSGQMRRIVKLCGEAGVEVRTLPAIGDLVSGRAGVRELRDISIVDLLGRDPVSLDWEAIGRGVGGRTVLVTGGGGSIGSELCRQVARLAPRSLVVADSSEYNLYRIERELVEHHPELALHAVLCDVCDPPAVEHLFAGRSPDVVFHAAAYKHVPMLESQAREAVRNNVLGTGNVARAATRHGCSTFVLISTDKAVNPVNVMGVTKRVAEVVCQDIARAAPRTRFVTVRFGNVLDSAGSVVPLFREQIERGGPITVTHPEVKRYFMTIPEACQLIMQAGAIGAGGEIYVLDMGEPVGIRYLAEEMIRLAGKTPGEDVDIAYIGLRPGEKLFEELFTDAEALSATEHDKLLLARGEEHDWAAFHAALDELAEACERFDEQRLRARLEHLDQELRTPPARPAAGAIPIERAR